MNRHKQDSKENYSQQQRHAQNRLAFCPGIGDTFGTLALPVDADIWVDYYIVSQTTRPA
jgi:hypothetical protein